MKTDRDLFAIPRFSPDEYDPDTDQPSSELMEAMLALFVQDKQYLKGFRPTVNAQALFGSSFPHLAVGSTVLNYYDQYGVPPNLTSLSTVLGQLSKKDEKIRASLGTVRKVAAEVYGEDLTGSIGMAKDRIRAVGMYEGYKEYLEKSLALLQQKRRSSDTYLKAEEYWRDFKTIGTNALDAGSWLFHPDHIRHRVQDRIRDMRRRIPTGYPVLDLALKGGFGAELIYLVAPWETGKTLFETNLVFNWVMAGVKPLIFTFEEGEKQYLSRVEQLMYGCSYEHLARIPKTIIRFMEDLAKSFKSDVHVKWFPADTVKVSTLVDYIENLRETTGWSPDVVLVDGGNLVLPERRREGRDDLEQGSVSLQYRNCAKAMSVPWMIGDQAKAEARNKKDVGGEDTGGSVIKVRTADIHMTLAADDRMRANNQVAVSLRKGRLGRSKIRLVMTVDKESGRLREEEPL